MLTQLLGSSLQNAPQINQEFLEMEPQVVLRLKAQTWDDVAFLGWASRKSYMYLDRAPMSVSLKGLETRLQRAKHAIVESEEEDFV